jgi:aspartyl protease family protein
MAAARGRVIAAGLLAAAALAQAQAPSVALAGRMGDRALLIVGGQTHTLAPGGSAGGVRLLRWVGDEAELDSGGQRLRLRVGGSPVQLGAAAVAAGSRSIVMPVGPDGHFMAAGSINGRPVRFMVDTGATTVALGQDEAQRLGLDLSGAQRALTQTANGAVPVFVTTLSRVRVGEVELTNIAATVLPQPLPFVLLGNSFLGRFSMQRQGDVMRLELR